MKHKYWSISTRSPLVQQLKVLFIFIGIISSVQVLLHIHLVLHLHVPLKYSICTSDLLVLLHLLVLKAVLCTVLFRFPQFSVAMVTGCATACPLPWQRYPVHHSLRFFPENICDVRRRWSFWTHHLPHSMLRAPPLSLHSVMLPLLSSLHQSDLISFISTRFSLCRPPPAPDPLSPSLPPGPPTESGIWIQKNCG